MNDFTYPVPPIGPLFDKARLHPELDCSFNETLNNLEDIRVFFEKEAAYERENMGAGGSQIALGRWVKYAKTLENLVHDLPEVRREKVALRNTHAALLSALRDTTHRIRYLLQFVEGMDEEATRNELKQWEALLACAAVGGK
jgi:hypothetical protein